MRVVYFISVLLLSFLFVFPQPVAADSCNSAEILVKLAPGLPQNNVVSGTLCIPTTYANGEIQVDLLVHGATYNRVYWDFPIQYPQYSYVKKTLGAGRATFTYDRLGTGSSSRPLSSFVTVQTDSYILHQVINWLRNEKDFETVNSIGHSFGSIMAIHEAALYQDVDRLVVTGLLHILGPVYLSGIPFYPAALDPQFAGQGYDLGYLTTLPGSRTVFYASSADPAVIAYDEAHKDVVSSVQAGEGLTEIQVPAGLNVSSNVKAPVLTVVGQLDPLFCGLTLDCTQDANVQEYETPFYTSAASLTARTIENTGHDLTLHPSAAISFEIINDWIHTN